MWRNSDRRQMVSKETLNHIYYLELLAAFLAIQCFAKQKCNITILLKMDNVTAVTYINKLGGPIHSVFVS